MKLHDGCRTFAPSCRKTTPAFILDDPKGDSWVMKSASLIVDPDQTHDSLKDLGGRLEPAPGWKFRAVVLEHGLVLTADNGAVTISQDDLGNTYDRAGGPVQQLQAMRCARTADRRFTLQGEHS